MPAIDRRGLAAALYLWPRVFGLAPAGWLWLLAIMRRIMVGEMVQT